jgi:uncharacterized membrane protein
MAPPRNNSEEYRYAAIPDVENVSKYAMEQQQVGKRGTDEEEIPPAGFSGGTVVTNKEPDTYNLPFAFSLLSGTVWFSMFLWGIWIAAFYSIAMANRNWHNFNIIFPDLWTDEYPVASIAISIHLIGAVFMSLAGAFQLVKYIRTHYAVFHRWVGRLYVAASIIASCGGLVFIFNKGSYGGREADVAFAIYGFFFLWCGLCNYYYAAIAKDYSTHKLWAWRLYALSLAAWIYRADYYYWMLVFGTSRCVLGIRAILDADTIDVPLETMTLIVASHAKTQAITDGHGYTMNEPVGSLTTLSTGPFTCRISSLLKLSIDGARTSTCRATGLVC